MADIKLTVDYGEVDNAKKSIQELQKTADKGVKLNIGGSGGSSGKSELEEQDKQLVALKNDYGEWTKTVSQNGRLQSETYKQISNGIETTTKLTSKGITVTQSAAKEAMTFGQQLQEAYSKFAIWSVATVSWYSAVNAIKDMVGQVGELDKSLVELQKVSNLEGESLKNFTNQAYEAADAVAKTGSEMVDAATEFAKSGFDENQILELGQIALMYTNIADEELTAGDAASFMISQMKAFNIEAEDSLHIVDALNEVSNNYAVSSADLSGAIGKVSATMAVSNTSYEQTLGLLTAVTEVTRNADKAANALKTISQRMRGVDEDGEKLSGHIGKLQAEFNKLGIAIQVVKDDGSMESTYNILTAVSQKWDSLTDSERQALGELAAGKNRITEFNALMSNYETAMSATETALNSVGSAAKENEKYLNSIEGKVQQFKSAWQDLSRNLINSELIKGITDFGTLLLKIADSGFGQLIIKGGLLITTLTLLQKGFILLKATDIGAFFSLFATEVIGATTVTGGLTSAVELLNTTLLASPLFWGVVAAGAIFGIVKAVDSLTTSFEEQSQKVDNLNQEYDSLSSQSDNIKKQIEDINTEISKLQSKGKITLSDEKDIENLKLEKEILEQQNTLLQLQQEEVKKAAQEETIRLSKEKQDKESWWQTETEHAREMGLTLNAALNEVQAGGYSTQSYTLTEEIEANIEAADNLKSEINKLVSENKKLEESNESGSKQYKKNIKDIEKYKEAQEKLQSRNIELSKTVSNWINNLKDAEGEGQNLRNSLIDLVDEIIDLNGALDDNGEKTNDNVNKQEQLKTLITTIGEDAYSTSEAIEKYNESLDNAQNSFNVLNTVIDEYNDKGYISLDNLQSLISLDGQYLAALQNENGQLSLNSQQTEKLTNNMKNQAYAAIEAAAYEDLLAQSQQDVGDTASSGINAVYNLGKNALQAGQYAAQGAKGFLQFADAAAEAGLVDKSKVNLDAWSKKWSSITASVSKTVSSAAKTSSYSGGSGSRSSKSSSKTTTDKNKEAFEKEYKALQHKLNMEQISEKTYTNKLEKLYKKYFKNKKKYADEYNKYEEEVYKNRKKLEEEEIKAHKDAFNKEYDALQHQLAMEKITEKEYVDKLDKLYKKYFKDKKKYAEEYAKYEEEVYKKSRELAEKDIEAKQKALDKLKDEAEEKYDLATKVANAAIQERIDEINKEKEVLENLNDETERALELAELQEALERAKTQKTQRVFYADRGWVWEADQTAIDAAQKALDEYVSEQEKEAKLKEYDDEIAALEDLKDAWGDVADAYELEQARQQVALLYGKDFEKKVLEERLELVKKFAEEYATTMDGIHVKEEQLVKEAASVGIDISDKYASGTLSANGGISLVGEEGPELRLLNQGDGIISNSLTKNLMEWGKINPVNYLSEMNKNIYTPTYQAPIESGDTYTFNNLKIESSADNLDALIKDIQIKSKNR